MGADYLKFEWWYGAIAGVLGTLIVRVFYDFYLKDRIGRSLAWMSRTAARRRIDALKSEQQGIERYNREPDRIIQECICNIAWGLILSLFAMPVLVLGTSAVGINILRIQSDRIVRLLRPTDNNVILPGPPGMKSIPMTVVPTVLGGLILCVGAMNCFLSASRAGRLYAGGNRLEALNRVKSELEALQLRTGVAVDNYPGHLP